MTLTNPTDQELNAAFAEHVVGFLFPTAPKDGKCEEWSGANYCGSADAVTPFLEKRARAITISYCDVTVQWTVNLIGFNTTWLGHSETLPRAAVVALLRANGVEVNFT